MRFTAIVPMACAVIAFLLSMLVLFAGDTPKFLPTVDLMTLNTSALGQIRPFGDSEPQQESSNPASNFIGRVKDKGNDAVEAVGGAVTDALDIQDFYSAHMMTFCNGNYKPDGKDPNAAKEVTECSERKAFFNFDPAAIISSKLPEGFGLDDLNWPKEISDGITAIKVASRAMFFFYIVGIFATGIATIGAVFGLLAYEHKVALANLAINSLGFLCLGLGSAIATAVIFRATNEINEAGAAIGLEADRGTAFLAMTWAASILMLIATCGWVGEFLMGRRLSPVYEKDYYPYPR